MSTAAGGASGRTAWARNLGAPVRDFLRTETGGAAVLVGAAIAALVWANGPWGSGAYHDFWSTRLAISLGDHVLANDLRGWVNEGLMTLFFLVVGLEAKRELDLGELRERSRLAVPVLASLGGMAAAVGIFLAVNAGGRGQPGWGAAISTDTALALGALAIVGPTGSTRLRVFLLTLVVVDDLVALVVIAVAYTTRVSVTALAVAVGLFAVLLALRYAPRWRGPAAALAGVGIWLALFESGIDPVIAGLAVGLVTSAYPPVREDLERATELTRSFREQPTPELASTAARSLASALSPNERIQHRLHPWTSFVIVPLFALANAGVHVDGDLVSAAATSPITLGIVGAYVIGKPVGILTAAWLATHFGGARLTVTWPGLAGTGSVAGVGFTVSLLIAGLAFSGARLEEATLGVLVAALVSPLVAAAAFAVIARLPAQLRARQLGGLAEQLIDLADDVDPARDHVRGRPDGSITLVEYGDFECPYCGRAEPMIREALRDDDDLRFVFRHLPLADVHPNAQAAAEAAEAAAAQGAFWEMHDLLFAHQDALRARDLMAYAGDLGLDVDRFREDLRQRRYASRVREDVMSADASGVSGTPTFFINGRRHYGAYDTASLLVAIRSARELALVAARA